MASDLQPGAELGIATWQSLGFKIEENRYGERWWLNADGSAVCDKNGDVLLVDEWDPSTDWTAFGALVEELERRGFEVDFTTEWVNGERGYEGCVARAEDIADMELERGTTLPHALCLAVVAWAESGRSL